MTAHAVQRHPPRDTATLLSGVPVPPTLPAWQTGHCGLTALAFKWPSSDLIVPHSHGSYYRTLLSLLCFAPVTLVKPSCAASVS